MRKTRKYRIFFGKRLVQNFEHRTDYRKHMKFEQEMGSKNLLPFFSPTHGLPAIPLTAL